LFETFLIKTISLYLKMTSNPGECPICRCNWPQPITAAGI